MSANVHNTVDGDGSELIQHDVLGQVLNEVLAQVTNDKESVVGLPREQRAETRPQHHLRHITKDKSVYHHMTLKYHKILRL